MSHILILGFRVFRVFHSPTPDNESEFERMCELHDLTLKLSENLDDRHKTSLLNTKSDCKRLGSKA